MLSLNHDCCNGLDQYAIEGFTGLDINRVVRPIASAAVHQFIGQGLRERKADGGPEEPSRILARFPVFRPSSAGANSSQSHRL